MTTAALECLRCGSTSFEEGFVDDNVQGRIRWHQGPMQLGLFGNAKRSGRLTRTVLAIRCTNCSRLELTAGEVT